MASAWDQRDGRKLFPDILLINLYSYTWIKIGAQWIQAQYIKVVVKSSWQVKKKTIT